MFNFESLGDPLYIKTSLAVLSFFIALGIPTFFFRTRNVFFKAFWSSLKSWFFLAPVLLFLFSFDQPWPLIWMTLIGIYGTKKFFQMLGMYHRTWFLFSNYIFMVFSFLLLQLEMEELYNYMPMIFLCVICLIPFIKNSAKNMIQYIALSLLAFVFFNWSFLHMARLILISESIYICLYIYILSEFAENFCVGGTKVFGKYRLFTNISRKFSLEGFAIALVTTSIASWFCRPLLPEAFQSLWLILAIAIATLSILGDLFTSVLKRDLNIKDVGIFIIGRGDVIDRMDKLIFLAPLSYYFYASWINW